MEQGKSDGEGNEEGHSDTHNGEFLHFTGFDGDRLWYVLCYLIIVGSDVSQNSTEKDQVGNYLNQVESQVEDEVCKKTTSVASEGTNQSNRIDRGHQRPINGIEGNTREEDVDH